VKHWLQNAVVAFVYIRVGCIGCRQGPQGWLQDLNRVWYHKCYTGAQGALCPHYCQPACWYKWRKFVRIQCVLLR